MTNLASADGAGTLQGPSPLSSSPEDAAILPFDIQQIKVIVDKLLTPETWPFLQGAAATSKGAKDIEELEGQCGQVALLLSQQGMTLPPRSFGRERIVLHLFSGRRRRGDVQF